MPDSFWKNSKLILSHWQQNNKKAYNKQINKQDLKSNTKMDNKAYFNKELNREQRYKQGKKIQIPQKKKINKILPLTLTQHINQIQYEFIQKILNRPQQLDKQGYLQYLRLRKRLTLTQLYNVQFCQHVSYIVDLLKIGPKIDNNENRIKSKKIWQQLVIKSQKILLEIFDQIQKQLEGTSINQFEPGKDCNVIDEALNDYRDVENMMKSIKEIKKEKKQFCNLKVNAKRRQQIRTRLEKQHGMVGRIGVGMQQTMRQHTIIEQIRTTNKDEKYNNLQKKSLIIKQQINNAIREQKELAQQYKINKYKQLRRNLQKQKINISQRLIQNEEQFISIVNMQKMQDQIYNDKDLNSSKITHHQLTEKFIKQ